MAHTFGSYVRFFCAAVLKQEQTGAIMPSQRFLVDKMIEPVSADFSGSVVELGAGTGALTVRLAQKCPLARITACEINPELARELRQNLDHSGINGQVQVVTQPADQLLSLLDTHAASKPEFIISGIPLGNVPRKKTFALLRQIRQALRDGGMYIQFQYSLLDRRKIQDSFASLRTVHVLLNFPPAFIYYARKQAHQRPVAARLCPASVC